MINEIYLNESEEPESQNVANMLKLGQKIQTKGVKEEAQPFMPFTIPPQTQEGEEDDVDLMKNEVMIVEDLVEDDNGMSESSDQASSSAVSQNTIN